MSLQKFHVPIGKKLTMDQLIEVGAYRNRAFNVLKELVNDPDKTLEEFVLLTKKDIFCTGSDYEITKLFVVALKELPQMLRMTIMLNVMNLDLDDNFNEMEEPE